MKKIKLLVFIGAISLGLLASGQVPQLIDYQGMARDGSGNPMANETISVRISILEGPLPGTMVYSEKHTPPTNAYGLFHLMIGDGNILFGTFNTINWASGNFYIQTEIDPAGGNAFVDMGKSKVATVPFAFYAASAGGGGSSPWQYNGSDIYYNAGNVAIGHDSPVELLHIHSAAQANALITSDQSYYIGDASGNSGLWMKESGADVAWLYWNPMSQAVFLYENNAQTMTWKDNNVGVNELDPLTRFFVVETGSAGTLGSEFGSIYSPLQTLSPAVAGFAENNTSNISYGLWGQSFSTGSDFSMGAFAHGGDADINNYGVYAVGEGSSSGYSIAVYGDNMGTASFNYAGYFVGDVNISGTLSKSGGSFKIDHPQDPANKYLVHSFVESPDMMNIYNGNVVTGADGMATVELPSYFESLNIDFRYQLTVMGQFAQAIVKDEISGNSFTIQTDKPNVKVSWQVTGVRNDPWAQQNRIEAEVEKQSVEKGRYLHPGLYGKSADKGMLSGVPREENLHRQPGPEKERDPRMEPIQK
jgi:hypothetical protein